MKTVKQKPDSFVLRMILLALTFALLARCASILYTSLASDVEYMESAWTTVVSILSELFASSFLALIYASAAVSAYKNKPTKILAFVLSAGVMLVYSMSAYLYDLFSGGLEGNETYVLLLVLASYAVDVLLLAAVTVICRISEKKGSTPYSASTVSLIAVVIVKLIYEGYTIMSFLIDYGFVVYPSEIASMVTEVIGIAAYSFAIPLAIGHASVRLEKLRKDNIK